MKQSVFFLLLNSILLLASDARSATYYLSSASGNDLHSGTEPDSAWQSISRLNQQILFAGDSVLFKSGETFYGSVNLVASGNSLNPIYFGKYSAGPLPEITGFKKLSNWFPYSVGYSTSDTNFVRGIWLNGKLMQIARYPNNGFLQVLYPFQSYGIYAPFLTQTDGYWEGATAVIRSDELRYELRRIDTFSQQYLSFDSTLSSFVTQYNGFFLQNNLNALDTLNEWYCDTSTNHVYIVPPAGINLSSATVNASILNYGILASADYIIIDSLSFSGQARDAIRFNNTTSHIQIMNCTFDKIKESAINIVISGDKIRILNNKISDCGSSAIISNFFFHTLIQNNNIRRTGLHPGFGNEFSQCSFAIALSSGIYDTVRNNNIDSTASSGIIEFHFGNHIEKNFINHSCLTLDNGAGISLYGSVTFQTVIKDNFILNTIGNIDGTTLVKPITYGIRLNSFCNRDTIIHNTILNTNGFGILIADQNYGHLLKNNLCFNNRDGQILFSDSDTTNATHDNSLQKNILYSLNDKQRDIFYIGAGKNFQPMSKCDSNYYCNPYDYFSVYRAYTTDSSGVEIPYTLESWRNFSNQDSSSKKSNVKWLSCYATDTVGSEQIINGNFSNNYDNWQTAPLNNNLLLLDNLTMMDGGCIKFIHTDTSDVSSSKIVSSGFAVSGSQLYDLAFSTAGTKNGYLFSEAIQNGAPYFNMGLSKYFPIDTLRTDFHYFFQGKFDDPSSSLDFKINYADSLVYFDNIHLIPVSVFKHDSSRMSVLLMNYSPNSTTINFPSDSLFRDLDGNLVGSSYSLGPYSSYVVVLDSPLIFSGVNERPIQNQIYIFPNPASSNENVYLFLPEPGIYQFDLFDLAGKKIKSGTLNDSNLNSISINNFSAGVYLLKVHSKGKSWQQKLVIAN